MTFDRDFDAYRAAANLLGRTIYAIVDNGKLVSAHDINMLPLHKVDEYYIITASGMVWRIRKPRSQDWQVAIRKTPEPPVVTPTNSTETR